MPYTDLTVLIVDDDQINRRVLAARIRKKFGCTITEAEDGESAITLLGEQPPDMLILDIMMPKVDGFAVLAFMEQRSELAGLPVLIYSALDDSADVKAVLAHKPFGYLLKPYVEDRVASQIKQALHAAAARKQALNAAGSPCTPTAGMLPSDSPPL